MPGGAGALLKTSVHKKRLPGARRGGAGASGRQMLHVSVHSLSVDLKNWAHMYPWFSLFLPSPMDPNCEGHGQEVYCLGRLPTKQQPNCSGPTSPPSGHAAELPSPPPSFSS